jgi:peptide/nickel transport system permease protein
VKRRPLPELPGLPRSEEIDRFIGAYRPVKSRTRRFRALAVPSLVVGLGILGFFGVVGLVALAQDSGHLGTLATNAALAANPFPPGPSSAHPFGEMSGIGVDEFPSMLQATPWDLSIFGGILVLASSVGAVLGGYGGVRPGIVRDAIGSVSDLMVAVPPFFLVWVVVLNVDLVVAPTSFVLVLIVSFAAILCFAHARGVLATSRVVATRPYVEAARASGASPARVLFRHVLPNSLAPVWAQLPADVFSILFLLTAFPYVGCLDAEQLQILGSFGYATPFPTLPFPEWGNLLASGACYGLNVVDPLATWWMWVFPTLAILVFAAGITLTSEGLQRLSMVRG